MICLILSLLKNKQFLRGEQLCSPLLDEGKVKMIKKCKVISYNKFLHILVFEFEGTQIQMTHTVVEDIKEIYVKFDGGKYFIVEKSEYEKYIMSLKEKSPTKRNKVKSNDDINNDEK